MKYLGFIVGLLIGAMMESLPAAIFFALAGAYGGHAFFGKKTSQEQPELPDPFSPSDANGGLGDATDAHDVGMLIDRVARLEARVATLEWTLSHNGIAPDPAGVTQSAKKAEVPTAATPPVIEKPVSGPPAVVAPVQPPKVAPVAASVTASSKATVPAAPPVVQSETRPPPQTPTQFTPKPAPVKESIPLRDRLPKPLAQLVFGGNMLVKLGVLILFLGLAFLLRYTAERVTVPIEMRYASVVMVGAGLLVLGWLLRRRRPDYAIVLQGAGIGVFYLTTLAAMKVHALLPATAGFAFLFGVSVLGAVLAVLQNSPTLAIIAVLEGFAAPVLASTGENHPIGLFTYLLVLDVGIFLVAWFKAWRILNLIGAVGTFTLAAGWAQKNYSVDQFDIVQPFLLVFFVLFVAIGFLFARRTLFDTQVDESEPLGTRAANTLRRVGRVDSTLAFGVPMAAFGFEYLMVKSWDMGPAFASMGFAAFYLLLGKWTWSTQPRGLGLLAEAYAIVGVIFATLAIPLGLEGQWTGAAWAVEAAGMYWLGVRQQRPYARAFSFAVFAGAVVKLLQATQLDGAPGHPLIEGSLIGPLLVAAGAFAMWTMHRRGKLDSGPGMEAMAGLCLPWLGMASLTLLVWQSLLPTWAAMATALLASATFVLAIRASLTPLVYVTYGMQALAVTSFIANLHRGSGDQVLASGWDGMVASLVIGASVLSSVAWSMLGILRSAAARSGTPHWSLGHVVAVVTGVALLHLSMLFQISLQQAALLWPISACLVLWVALRIGHPALALQAAGLQLISALIYVSQIHASPEGGAFAGLNFWIPAVLGLAALLCGDMVRGGARERNPWSAGSRALWMPIVWGLFWWLLAMLGESYRALHRSGLTEWVPTTQLSIVLATSMLASFIARQRIWKELGQATVATLPGIVLIGLAAMLGSDGSAQNYVPSQAMGWLAWPLALLWHLRLLSRQESWFARGILSKLHVSGFWFFLLVASRECQWLLGSLGDIWSSWPLLGWVLVPAIALWALQTRQVLARWPLTVYRQAYLQAAAFPVVGYLLLWAWVSNFASPGNADPLPYLPLLNPLELAHWLILGAVIMWWRSAGLRAGMALSSPVVRGGLGLTALVLLTGVVLRSCHHFADVPWEWETLYASRLTQAALSVVWALCGVAVMVLGHSRSMRMLWVAGATLLGVVVLKLFFVELADQGGLFRIVSFLSVGVLLLAVGYFAPVPPAKRIAVLAEGEGA